MKQIFYFAAFLLVTAMGYSQTITTHPELGQAWGGGTTIDINNDGHLDFYISGNKNNPKEPLLDEAGNPLDLDENTIPDTTERWQRLYMWNTGTNQYEVTPTSLRMIERANLDWADVDGDGLLDLLATEHNFDPDLYKGGVYKNLGTGMFEKLDYPLPVKANASAWADFNNDGLVDYVALSVEIGVSGVYINGGNGTFTATNTDVFGEYMFGIPYCEVIDYNNDGFMDIFVTSNCDNPIANDGARVIADVFINYDEEPGNFYRALLGKSATNTSGSIFQKGNGGVDFADFNSDGWLDMVLHGEGGTGTIETGTDDWTCISHVYLNQKDGTYADKPQPAFQADLRPLGSSGVGTATIDWNNDGNYDLFITGWNPPTVNTQAGYMYTGDGAGNFTAQGRIPGGSETIVLFPDWNGDGFPDYLVSGHSWDIMFYPEPDQGRTGAIMLNNNTSSANAAPSAPTGLAAAVDAGNVTLSWAEATDDKTPSKSLSYEYFLKDGTGKFIMSPASFVGGDKDGLRKIQKLGNCFLNKSAKLRGLDNGNYTWGVQAIDAQYKGSAFATGSFTVGNISVKENKVDLATIYSVDQTLNIRMKSSDQANLIVYNLIGQPVIRESFSGSITRNLPAGVYVVKIAAGKNIQTTKVNVR